LKIALIGLGNPIVGDDAIGIRTIEYIRDAFEIPTNVDVIPDVSSAGIGLVELFRGYDKVIIVDSIQTGQNKPGHVLKLKPEEIATALHVSDYHNMDFFTALEFANEMYNDIPKDITIIGIEIINVLEFSDNFSKEIQDKFEEIVTQVYEMILQELREEIKANVI
jgi:hydrogenase maturation protease